MTDNPQEIVDVPRCATRHDTLANGAVLAAIVLAVLFGITTIAFDPVNETTVLSTQPENRHA